MTVKEAETKLNNISYLPFDQVFNTDQMSTIIKNKGKTGQILEQALGKPLDNSNLDFEDGELKSNKCDRTGKPLETVCITQISTIIDDLLNKKPFFESRLYEKISNILYVPVCKEKNPSNWMFLQSINVNLSDPRFSSLKKIWEDDYYKICELLKVHIENDVDGFIHTSNGRHLQIRSKDSKPYHPIYSNLYGRNVSNKNHAFYFQKQFVKDIRKMGGN